MRRGRRARALLLAAVLAVSCGGDGGESGGGGGGIVPVVPSIDVLCADDNALPTDGSVVLQCGAASGQDFSVDVVITNPPSGVSSLSVDLNLCPPTSLTCLSLQGHTVGPALGADVTSKCSVNTPELVCVVARQGGPGVAVSGSQTALTLDFRYMVVDPLSLVFLAENQPDGSALLETGGDGLPVIIPGITFSGATVSGTQ